MRSDDFNFAAQPQEQCIAPSSQLPRLPRQQRKQVRHRMQRLSINHKREGRHGDTRDRRRGGSGKKGKDRVVSVAAMSCVIEGERVGRDQGSMQFWLDAKLLLSKRSSQSWLAGPALISVAARLEQTIKHNSVARTQRDASE